MARGFAVGARLGGEAAMLNALRTTRFTLHSQRTKIALHEKLPLQMRRAWSICPLRFGDADEIVDVAQRGFVFFGSSVRLCRQQRSESLALRHDAAGF